MYKTGVITDEISQDIVVAAKLVQKYGLDALEIRSVNEKNPFEMEKRDYIRIKEVADGFGLYICGISSPFFKCSMEDEKAVAAHYEGLKRCIEASQILGCNIIRGFTFWNDGKGRESFEKIVLLYQEAVRLAKENNIIIAIESEPSVCTHNMALLAEFLELASSPYIAALWDPGNEVADPMTPPPYPDGYERLKPYIRHVHLKDMKRTATGGDPAIIGEGDVDFHGALKRLVSDGYSGYVTVETHYRFKARLDESTLVRPQGSGFSEGGYEATDAYLNILQEKYDWRGSVK